MTTNFDIVKEQYEQSVKEANKDWYKIYKNY